MVSSDVVILWFSFLQNFPKLIVFEECLNFMKFYKKLHRMPKTENSIFQSFKSQKLTNEYLMFTKTHH